MLKTYSFFLIRNLLKINPSKVVNLSVRIGFKQRFERGYFIMGTKKCIECLFDKDIDSFLLRSDTHRRRNICNGCINERLKQKRFKPIPIMDGEIWANIEGYDGIYKISNYGRVKSSGKTVVIKKKMNCTKVLREKLIKQRIDTRGYYAFKITHNGLYKNYNTHRLLALAFIPNPENKPEVNHIDGNKLNISLSNLEWATVKENAIHAFAIGLRKQGELHHRTRLSGANVLEILRMKTNGSTHSQLAEKFATSKGNIQSIVEKRSWKKLQSSIIRK